MYSSQYKSLPKQLQSRVCYIAWQSWFLMLLARIVSTSQPRANWSAPNFLLLTSIAISITAIFSSLVCLGLPVAVFEPWTCSTWVL